ncbi:hypothetical protein P280DRAFT_469407 [Massarina eburnea CBS 473.64]|uniref:GST C-terminal domain-containing protein n=1 Tax=Massarina eburnea CBS 473.64 TaxID=1395130 RepID=A0A6A6S0V8_9PLEO|nr:hypothetical protein P280DRAFT_469407 [Massarina eburnea CBS 473.64]
MTQTTIPTLHHLAHAQSLRISWALEEIQLADPTFHYHQKNYPRTIQNTDLTKVHRLGKSPILTLETTDGSAPPTIQLDPGVLSESSLILEFLNAEYANGLWTPASLEEERRSVFFADFATSSLLHKVDFCVVFESPAQFAPFPFNLLFAVLAYPMLSRFLADLLAIFRLLEDALSDRFPYFSGARLGVADINMSFGMDMAEQRGYVSFEDGRFPKLKGWGERIRAREGYRRAVAKSGGYDLKTFGMRGGWAMVFGGGLMEG